MKTKKNCAPREALAAQRESATEGQAESTPLPWIITPTGPTMAGYSQPLAIVEYGAGNLIAGVFGDVRGGHRVTRANAELIVRAVNNHSRLVEALKLILPDFESGYVAQHSHAADHRRQKHEDRIRQVLKDLRETPQLH